MNKKIKTNAVDHLFDAMLTLKNPEECYKFFEDICTINKLLSLSQCYEVVKMLREDKTYLEIADKTRAPTATISRVDRSLSYGSDEYDMVLSRLQADCGAGELGNKEQADILKHETFRAWEERITRRMRGQNIRSSFIDLNLSLN